MTTMHHAFRRQAVVALALAGLLLLLLPGRASAATSPSLTISPTSGPVGTSVTVSGGGYLPSTTVQIWFDTTNIKSILSNAAGSYGPTTFNVPSATQGLHPVWALDGVNRENQIFTVTPPLAHDTSAPSVSWTSPVANGGIQTVSSGTVTLEASASDNIGVARVTFTRWDAVAARWVTLATVSTAPWRTSIAVSSLNGGYNQINVQAWDAAGNASTSPYIWLYRPDTSAPSVSWKSPVGNGATSNVSSGSVTLVASASDNIGVARVKFTRWDAVKVIWVDMATVSSAPWQTTVNVATLNSGYNQINMQAWDAAGNTSTSPYIWLNRTPATISDRIAATANAELSNATRNFETGTDCNFYSGAMNLAAVACGSAGWRAEAWCADFARWTWFQSGAQTSGLDAGAISFKTYGTWHSDPTLSGVKAGDVLGWNFGGGTADDHVSVVTSVNSNGTLTTVDGNWNDRVSQRTINPNASGLSGYASPSPVS